MSKYYSKYNTKVGNKTQGQEKVSAVERLRLLGGKISLLGGG
jgi:hypothetical protein